MPQRNKNKFFIKILTATFVVVVCFGFVFLNHGIKNARAQMMNPYSIGQAQNAINQARATPGSGVPAGYTYQGQVGSADGTLQYYSNGATGYIWNPTTNTGQTATANTTYYDPDTGVATVAGTPGNVNSPTTPTASSGLGIACFQGGGATNWGPYFTGLPCAFGWAIAYLLIIISSGFMYISSILFNGLINYSIVGLASHIGQGGDLYDVILGSWKTFRDVGNIFFIFILLYIAISTILRLNSVDTKKLLTSVIIVALLVNFSMFFAEVIIDGSNILALAFYSQITVTGGSDGGLASAYINNLGLGAFFGSPGTSTTNSQTTSSIPAFTSTNWMTVLFIAILTAVVLFVVGFVLLISSILFLIRYIVFIFLLILSPLAFVGSILPKTKSMISDKWWKTLFDQALFAPVYFMLSWATVSIMHTVTLSSAGGGTNTNIWALFSGGSSGVASLLIKYMIIIAMLITTLIISKSMASSGGDAVKKSVDWASGKAGGLYGRTAARVTTRAFTGGTMGLSDVDKKFSKSRFGNTTIGRGLRNITTGAAMGAKFGDKQSLTDIVKKKKEANDKYAKHVEEEIDKNYEKDHLPEQRKASLANLEPKINAALNARINAATQEERDAADEKYKKLRSQKTDLEFKIKNETKMTSDEKNTIHYKTHLGEQAKKLKGTKGTQWLHSQARKTAAKHVKDKFLGKQSSAEEILSAWNQQNPQPGGAPATPVAPRAAGGTAHP